MAFENPGWLGLLVLVPLLTWRLFRRVQGGEIAFSATQLIGQLPRTLRQRLQWLPKLLTLVTLVLLIVVLARPRVGREQTVSETEGIAIEMVVDRSSSMRAMDFKLNESRVDRLTAIKNVASRFVQGEGALNGRFSDLIGLVVFGGFADALSPPTLDHNYLVSKLLDTSIVSRRDEDGTAIGDAISLAVQKLTDLDAKSPRKIPSKIIILLTDGENTAGETEPILAAELAQSLGIKIYAIGVGTEGQAPIPVRDPFSGQTGMQWMQVTIDEETLQKVADTTQGKYFRAVDTHSLEKIYAEIDQLEKTQVETKHFVSYREMAVETIPLNWIRVPSLLFMAFLALLARWILESTWLGGAL